MEVQVLFLLTLLLNIYTLPLVTADCSWGEPPFELDDKIDSTIVNYDEDMNTIHVDEEESGANELGLYIAKLNYDEELKKDDVSLSEPTNRKDFWDIKQDNGQQYLWFSSSSNFEEIPDGTVNSFAVIIKGRKLMDITWDNRDDNPPRISRKNAAFDCRVLEEKSADYETSCTFQIDDDDGCADMVETKFNDGQFYLKSESFSSKYPDCLTSPAKSKTTSATLYIRDSLDYETISSYFLTISIWDKSNNKGADLPFVLYVDDAPDQIPVWQGVQPSITVEEETSRNFTVLAVDGDRSINANINYEITNISVSGSVIDETEKKWFTIDSNSGQVTIEPIDRDRFNHDIYSLQITAFEELNHMSKTDPITVTVFVTDVNDNAPQYHILCDDCSTSSAYPTQKILEEKSGTLEYKFTVTDPDEGDGGWFTLSVDKYSETFSVIPSTAFQSGTFQIQYFPIDYETSTQFDFTVVITENENTTHTARIPIHIDVTDVNDNFPEFDPNSILPATVEENVPIDSLLTTVKATDKDAKDTLFYFTNSNDFKVDTDSGAITLSTEGLFDYERQTEVLMQVYASDGVHNVSATITFKVKDINDTPPTVALNGTSIQVDEGLETFDTNLAVTARDQDTNAVVTAEILWDQSRAFKDYVLLDISANNIDKWFILKPVDDAAANIKVFIIAVNQKVKWDIADSVQLSIVATDQNTVVNSHTSVAAVASIQINNVDDNPPVITNCDATFNMKEESEADAKIGFVTAVDPDGAISKLTFTIESQLYADTVIIEEESGLLTTGTSKYDVDTNNENYVIIVSVTDGIHPPFNCNITIKVTDINDIPPKVYVENSGPTTIEIPENTTSGEKLFQLKSEDLDKTEEFRAMYWNLEDLTYSRLFALSDKSGNSSILSVNYTGEGFDFDAPDSIKQYVLTVSVCDVEKGRDGDDLCTPITLSVNVTDVNDNDPIFPKVDPPDQCLFTVSEGTESGGILKESPILAIDNDVQDNLNYTIVNAVCNNNTSNVCSSINPFNIINTGSNSYQITAAIDLKGHYGNYQVQMKVSDGSRVGETNVTFCISDINDNPPIFMPPYAGNGVKLLIVKDGDNLLLWDDESKLSDIQVSDLDWAENGANKIDVVTVPPNMFTSKASGRNSISLVPAVDFNDLSETIEVTVTAQDETNAPLKNSTSFTILRIITDEFEPTFEELSVAIQFPENTTEILPRTYQLPIATDLNNVNVPELNQSKIYYYLAEGDKELFAVDNNAILSLNGVLDASQINNYSLTIQASNNDQQPTTHAARSVITVEVKVFEINDKWPVFTKNNYIMAVTNLDTDKIVDSVSATDKDAGDVIKYALVSESIEINVNPPSANADGLISVDSDRGDIYVTYPQNVQNGNISFDISATDKENHQDFAHVLVHFVPEMYLLVFSFNNSRVSIDANKEQIAVMISQYFNYKCIVHQTKEWGNYANLSTFFLDENITPVDPNQGDIKLARDNFNLIANLSSALSQEFGFHLIGAGDDTSVPPDDVLVTALIVVSVVLMVLFMAIVTLYFIKTRRLSDLVKRLTRANVTETEVKGTALPNTNAFKEEGSNPVWNTEISAQELDNVSMASSNDSGLIGIEDNPEFQDFYNRVILKEQQTPNLGDTEQEPQHFGAMSGGADTLF